MAVIAKHVQHRNLFLQMEAEREKDPHILRKDYIPVFVVKLLRDKLCESDDSRLERSNRQLGLARKGSPVGSSSASEGEKWTDDSILADYVDFEGSFLMTEESLVYTDRVLAFAKEAMEIFRVDYGEFAKYFMDIEFPSLELLWLIDCRYNLFSFSSYLMQLKHAHQIQFFKRQFLSFCFSPSHLDTELRDRCTAILEHIVHILLISAYCNTGKTTSLLNLKALAKDNLYHLTEKLIRKPSQTFEFISHHFLLNILQEAHVPNSVKRRYFLHQLTHSLTDTSSNPNSTMSLDEVIQFQERFVNPTFLSENQALGDTFVMMMGAPMTTVDLLEVISMSILSPSKNWERILRLITEWIRKAEYEATSAVKEYVKELMQEGLSSRIGEKVTLAFILARHCSLFAPRIFSRYETWYSHMFESELYSPAKDPDAFNFLANLLTQWIPFEPSCFLQVQATFWPHIPTGCKAVWSDYVSLAKVRVAEYNEVEGAMEFEPNPNNPVQYDVEMAIKGYENTRNMPQRVARMWMFNKHYYLDQFLPVLLKKPLAAALSDARLRLIEVLNKDGKIPPEMYAAYKNSSGS